MKTDDELCAIYQEAMYLGDPPPMPPGERRALLAVVSAVRAERASPIQQWGDEVCDALGLPDGDRSFRHIIEGVRAACEDAERYRAILAAAGDPDEAHIAKMAEVFHAHAMAAFYPQARPLSTNGNEAYRKAVTDGVRVALTESDRIVAARATSEGALNAALDADGVHACEDADSLAPLPCCHRAHDKAAILAALSWRPTKETSANGSGLPGPAAQQSPRSDSAEESGPREGRCPDCYDTGVRIAVDDVRHHAYDCHCGAGKRGSVIANLDPATKSHPTSLGDVWTGETRPSPEVIAMMRPKDAAAAPTPGIDVHRAAKALPVFPADRLAALDRRIDDIVRGQTDMNVERAEQIGAVEARLTAIEDRLGKIEAHPWFGSAVHPLIAAAQGNGGE